MLSSPPSAFYANRLSELGLLEKKQLATRNRLAWLRFFALATAFVLAWLLWSSGIVAGLGGFVAGTGLFIFFLRKDLSNNDAIENTRRLIRIDQTELQVLEQQFTQLDDGISFQPALHPYAQDLDIFGHASLFQYSNRSTSEQGAACWASWLGEPAGEKEIGERQEAAKELAGVPGYCAQLRAYGLANKISFQTEERIERWLQEKNRFLHQPAWRVLRILLPFTGLAVLAGGLSGLLPANLFWPSSIALMIAAFSISKMVLTAHMQLSRISPQLDSLWNSSAAIEENKFTAPLLKTVQENFSPASGPASKRIRALSRILERMDLRLNFLVFIPLNTYLFWDLQQVFALENWKQTNKEDTGNWFRSLARMEALVTLGTLHFNHPAWTFPVISPEAAVFDSTDLGHPLIPPAKRVTSSFSTRGNGKLSLVTGSNMAGKSTFLRSIGVNMVLAMAGAPVCAHSMTLSPLKVMSSMRISDNLEESTSTFYAELKKLKTIIEAVHKKENVFLLLDEILRGTNSADRHTGSAALIRQLIKEGGSGLLATHDLELAALAKEFPGNISNYHFDVQVRGEELYFDYKLKEGICESMNASLLMKKIGIQM